MPISRTRGFRTDMLDYLPEHLEACSEFVYAIWDGSAIKIGRSAGHPKLRLDALQTGNPRNLQLLAYTAAVTERRVHQILSRHRLRGEWFSPSKIVLGFISTWCWVNCRVLSTLLQGKGGA